MQHKILEVCDISIQFRGIVALVWDRQMAAFIGTPMEWSAKQCQTDQPFGSWGDDLANAFVQLEPRKIAEHPFQGTISRTDATPIRISRVTATKHREIRIGVASVLDIVP